MPSEAPVAQPELLAELSGLLGFATGDWCLLREPAVARSDAAAAGDLDIWVAPERLASVARVLLEEGWELDSGRSLRGRRPIWSNVTLRFRKPLRYAATVELASGALRWASVPYWAGDRIASEIEYLDGLPHLAGAGLLAVLITRIALRGELAGERLSRAHRAWQAAGAEQRGEWRQECEALLGRRVARELEACVAAASAEPRGLPGPRWLLLRATARGRVSNRQLLAKAGFVLLHRLGPWIDPSWPLVIALIGTDGSGKSSLAEALREALERRGQVAHVRYWGRSRGNSRVVEALRRSLFRLLPPGLRDHFGPPPPPTRPDESEQAVPRGASRNLAGALAAMGFVVYLVEYAWRTLRLAPLRGRPTPFVLLDRCIFDLVQMKSLPDRMRALVWWGIKPDYLVFCDAPAELIFERKPERSLSAIRVQQARYHAIFERWMKSRYGRRVLTERARPQTSAELTREIELLASARRRELDGPALAVLLGRRRHP